MIGYVIASLLYGATLGFLALEDMRRFEIKLELLPVTGIIGMWLALQSGLPLWDILAGGAIWGSFVALFYWFSRGSIGQGDIWLFATAGLCLGVSDSLAGALVFGAASIATSWAYSHARGKRFGRSIYPAAVPVSVALLAVCAMRMITDLGMSGSGVAMSLVILGLLVAGVALGISINMFVASNGEVADV